MLIGKCPTTQRVLDEVRIENFLKSSSVRAITERENISSKMTKVLTSMEERPTEYRIHLEKVYDFLSTLWTKYDCKDIIGILEALTTVEPPLLDLERQTSKRYRDHYVHIFNVFILGLRMLSLIIDKLGDKLASDMLKVKDERVHSKIPEFHDYHWKERLFYLWTLISNFHDISIPVTRLGGVRDGLNRFLKKFGMEVSGPTLLPYFPSDLEDYFQLLGCIFEGKMQAVEEWCYNRDCTNSYVQGVLRHEFSRQNHGVLSGFLMYKKIQEIFLEGRNKSPLYPNSFNQYTEYVLKQDIARAALAISLHDLKPDADTGYPKFLPLDFFDYPLTCLLILVDNLQEYLRWEGTSIRGGTKLLLFPEIAVDVEDQKIRLDVAFFVTAEPDAQEYLINQAQFMAESAGRTPRGTTLGDAIQDLCDCVANELAIRLKRNKSFKICLSFWDNENQLISRDIHI